ncbi:hypothetical protein [Streptacidiphilus fuscans]|uniref:Uncharacterized protein n=1 Tax=Streptacidiphilus fuscans TaxID=2789292 RepID=A0A931BC75_9ACTN|nr:hypothetical protein [Streptacidiphilus fuscans]MBF9071543.1 hypothetical protein [Streptacidiphilus fuscans]
MLIRHLHRHNDVNLVMSALARDPQQLPVLIALGAALRTDLAKAMRETIATRAWQDARRVCAEAARYGEMQFHTFWEMDLEKRRDRGPKREHLDAALLTHPETRIALYRVLAADSPQHCRSDSGDHGRDEHVEDYQQALYGWYAAIRHAHGAVVAAARWFLKETEDARRRYPSFVDLLTDGRTRGHRNSVDSSEASHQALRELLLMMHAWSPHTFEAIDVAFKNADGGQAFHGWGAGFEPAGRQEAQEAAEALAVVLTPAERTVVRGLVANIETLDEWGYDRKLAGHDDLPCTSDKHRSLRHTDTTDERTNCAKARARVHHQATQLDDPTGDRSDAAARLASLLLGSRIDRLSAALRIAGDCVPEAVARQAPQIWRDNAADLCAAREATGLDEEAAAACIGVQPASLRRFERASGKHPGAPVSLRYLQLLAHACADSGYPVPACISPSLVAEKA